MIILITSFGLQFHCAAQQVEQRYFYDEEILSGDQKSRFLNIRDSVDNLSGGEKELSILKNRIESFIKDNPTFLPIYIERARHTIILGYTGIKEVGQYDREALAIVEDIKKKNDQYAKSYVLAGHIHTNLGDYKNAELSLKKAASLGTTDPWLFLNWATLKSFQGDIESALSFSRQGLEFSGTNTKALVYAISTVTDFSSKLGRNSRINIDNIVFSRFEDPYKRLEFAGRLMAQYRGRPEILNHAYQITVRQKKETPELPECDFRMASIILAAGQLPMKGDINRYSERAMASAKSLLTPHINDEKIREGVVYQLFGIAMSGDDFKRAQELISIAEKNGFKATSIKNMQAIYAYSQAKYMETVERINELVEMDSAWESMALLAKAYDRLGNTKILEDYHQRSVSRSPTDPWILGNYAKFLLHKKGDYTGAIKYGERAMDVMMYSSIIGNTAMAYHVAAADYLKKGDKSKAAEFYREGMKLNVSQSYMDKYCSRFCKDIKTLGELK